MIVSDNSLLSKRRQTIIWTSDGVVYWRIYAPLGVNEWIRVLWLVVQIGAVLLSSNVDGMRHINGTAAHKNTANGRQMRGSGGCLFSAVYLLKCAHGLDLI